MDANLVVTLVSMCIGFSITGITTTWYLANYSKAIEDNLKKYTDKQIRSSVCGLDIGDIQTELKHLRGDIADWILKHQLLCQQLENEKKLKEANDQLIKAKVVELYLKNKGRTIANSENIKALIQEIEGLQTGLNRNGVAVRQTSIPHHDPKMTDPGEDNSDFFSASGFS